LSLIILNNPYSPALGKYLSRRLPDNLSAIELERLPLQNLKVTEPESAKFVRIRHIDIYSVVNFNAYGQE